MKWNLAFMPTTQKWIVFAEFLDQSEAETFMRDMGTVEIKGTSLPRIKAEPKPKEAFTLLEIYKAYPRHEGKTRGLKVLEREIKTQDDYDLCLSAAKNYGYVKSGTEAQYLKLFSTWANEWREWIPEFQQPTSAACTPTVSDDDLGALFSNV